VLQEFYVTLTKKIPHPLAPKDTRQIIEDLANWKIYSPIPDDLIQASKLQEDRITSFWDAMVLQSALRLGCKQLWSEDLSHGQSYDNLTVRNPFLE
jgi:predicted nucleic acid-binding protein